MQVVPDLLDVIFIIAIASLKSRLETLNEKRSGVVQMVKLAEKERDNLEVRRRLPFLCVTWFLLYLLKCFFGTGCEG